MCSPLHYSYLSTGHDPPSAAPGSGDAAPDDCPVDGSRAIPTGRDAAPPPTGQAPDQLRRLATDGRTAPAGPRV